MAIDFTLTPQQRELQHESRRFALEVLAGARAAELLPTAEERFLATRPVYEAMVVAGFLRKCIPRPAGGENAGLIDMAIMAEEFYSVNASVTLRCSVRCLVFCRSCWAARRSSVVGCSLRS
jgi:nitroalkane oxidase